MTGHQNNLNYHEVIDIVKIVLSYYNPVVRNTYNIYYVNDGRHPYNLFNNESNNIDATTRVSNTRNIDPLNNHINTIGNSLENIFNNLNSRNTRQTYRDLDNNVLLGQSRFNRNYNFNTTTHGSRHNDNLARSNSSNFSNINDRLHTSSEQSNNSEVRYEYIPENNSPPNRQNRNFLNPQINRILNETRDNIFRNSDNSDLNPTNFEIYISEKNQDDSNQGLQNQNYNNSTNQQSNSISDEIYRNEHQDSFRDNDSTSN